MSEHVGCKWTPEEDNKLLALHRSGLCIETIAERHGRSRGAIVSRLAKHKFVQPEPTISFSVCGFVFCVYQKSEVTNVKV